MNACTETRGKRDKGVVVVGAGAIGTLFGVKIAQGGTPVAFQVRTKELVHLYERRGLTLIEGSDKVKVEPYFFEAGAVPPIDPLFVIVAVKAYETLDAVAPLVDYLDNNIPVVTLQNGMRPPEDLKILFGEERVILAITTEGATKVDRYITERKGRGRTFLVPLANGDIESVKKVLDTLRVAGFDAVFPREGWRIFWKKLLVSLTINPISAVTGMKNGEIVEAHEGVEIIKRVIREALPVAQKIGTKLDYDEVMEFVLETARNTAENLSSMLQDITSCRKTEIDEISGELIRKAKSMGIKVPTIETLYNLVKMKERSY